MHLSHALTHRGTVREINEDAYLELPHLGVWVVADGMGGHAAGDVASQLVIDSRIYLMRDQQMKQMTKDHSQVNDMIDEGLLSPEEAETHPLANVITRAVGVDTQLDIDYRTDKVKDGDVFLLCSDGLNKELNDIEIERTIKSGNIIDSGLALLHASLVRNARDNVTCILVKNSHKNINIIDDSDKTIPIFSHI